MLLLTVWCKNIFFWLLIANLPWKYLAAWWDVHKWCTILGGRGTGGFHLHLLLFPFVYQFHSRTEALVCSSFANKWLVQKDFSIISTSFQTLFVVIVTWKRISFYPYLFCCTEMRWFFISSSAIWVTGSDISSVASRARSELTRSKCEKTQFRCGLVPNSNKNSWTVSMYYASNYVKSHWNATDQFKDARL